MKSRVGREAHNGVRRMQKRSREQHQISVFDVVLLARGRLWQWRVCDPAGKAVMQGRERTRAEARYRAEKALFLLLSAAKAR